jgi:glycosyltransferase involved in cell wall biosynthesis
VSPVDVVLATMSPFDSCAAAERLARHHGVPWVADLRDPWALDEMRVYASRIHRRLELRRMRRALRSAAGIVMNTPEAAAELIRAFPELTRSHVVVIPNGFDAADFESPHPARAEGAFRIVHTGYLHTAFGLRHREARLGRRLLGGALGDVDILPRSHVFLLEAVERLLSRRPDLRDFLEVHLAGGMDEADRNAVDSDTIKLHGYVTHGEAISLMRSADLLFLPMHDVRPPRRARIVPGKTYEYLASGTPILAAVPDGDARDLLAEAGTARLVRPSDVTAMEREIEAAADQKLAGDEARSPSAQALARFERRTLARALAEALEAVTART